MAGLMSDRPGGMAQGGGMPMAQPPESGDGQSNVTPEEQAQYDAFVDQAYRIIYSEQTFQQFMERLRQSAEADPAEALARLTVMVVVRVQESARRNGRQTDPEVVFHAGVEILESLADTADKAGIHTYTPDEIEAASLVAMDMYRTMAGEIGLVDQQAAQRDLAMFEEADRAGQLDKVLPGVAERYGRIGRQAADNQPPSRGLMRR